MDLSALLSTEASVAQLVCLREAWRFHACRLTFSGEKEQHETRKKFRWLAWIMAHLMNSLWKRETWSLDLDEVTNTDSSLCKLSHGWLHGIVLTEDVKAVITLEQQLTHKDINFVREIITVQFKFVVGLWSTLLVPIFNSNFQQLPLAPTNSGIIHGIHNHWIVVSTVGCSSIVKVFDALYKAVNKMAQSVLYKDVWSWCENWNGKL